MHGSEDDDIEEDKQHFWHTRSEKRSNYIFIGFVTVTILMAVVVISTGVYGYYSWQEWRKGPQVRIEEGLFEFRENGTQGEVDITVYITLINHGPKESGELTLEWLIMKSVDSPDNIVLREGSKVLPHISTESTSSETFDISLPEGDYVIAYRVYEDQLFSYEARQNINVGPEDVEHDSPDTVMVPEFSSLFIPLILVLLLFYIIRRRYYHR